METLRPRPPRAGTQGGDEDVPGDRASIVRPEPPQRSSEPPAGDSADPSVPGEGLPGEPRFDPAWLAEELPPVPPDLGPTTVEPGRTVGALAYSVLRRQFASFLRHEPGTRLGDDPEDLHDMRVASRRLRAALALFAQFLPRRAASFRSRLGRIGRSLGEVRDLDVLLDRLRMSRLELDPEEAAALDGYARLVEERRARARRRMLRLLNSREYARLVESFSAFLRRGPTRRARASRASSLATAPGLIEVRFRKVRKLGDRLDPSSPPADFHAMRIRCKRLRYALEFHSDLYGDEARALIDALIAVQDLLGLHQDTQVSIERIREASRARPRALCPRALFAMGRLVERHLQQAEALRGRFRKAYRRVRGKRWKRLRAAMEAARPRAPNPSPREGPPELP